jgi:hypothetical protein
MEEHEILDRLNNALRQVAERGRILLQFDFSER